MSAGRTAFDTIVRRHAGRPRTVIAWDLDGTLVDPQPRMLATVRAFGVVDAPLRAMRPTWQQTAEALDLDLHAFARFWHEHFWREEAFLADAPIPVTVRCARAAASVGLAPLIITGRVRELLEPTRAQLARIGLADATLVLKPGFRTKTPRWKAQILERAVNDGTRVAAFVTDSLAEIQEARARVHGLRCILVTHGAQRQADSAPAARVPTWRVQRARVPASVT